MNHNDISPIIINELLNLRDEHKAEFFQSFFKTGPGQYGEGDKFLGISNPQIRQVAKEYYKQISNDDIKKLLRNDWHEIRLCTLVMMNTIMPKASPSRQQEIYNIYIDNISRYVNNWDLVDISAPHVIGYFLQNHDREVLYSLATGNLWEKRVAIISTLAFVRHNDFTDAMKLSEILMYEKHDLLHKAVGWVMREIGKRDLEKLEFLLDKYASTMPRTTLRYAIEKFNKEKRSVYLSLRKK